VAVSERSNDFTDSQILNIVIVPAMASDLYIAQIRRRAQAGQRILQRKKFMCYIAPEFCRCNGAHHAIPLYLLSVVKLVPPRHAAGMEMADPRDVRPNRRQSVPFHDLHVINVVEQLHVWRIHLFHYAHAPCGMVSHVVGVVHLAVSSSRQIVIPLSSAIFFTRFRPTTVLRAPSSSVHAAPVS